MKKLKQEDFSPVLLVLSIFAMLAIYATIVHFTVQPLSNENQYEYIYVDNQDYVDK